MHRAQQREEKHSAVSEMKAKLEVELEKQC